MKELIGGMILTTIEFFGLSQIQAAHHLGITPQALNHYIKGQRTIDLDMLCHIMKMLEMEPNYVFGWTLHPSSSIIVSLEELQLIAYIRCLSNYEQQELLKHVKMHDQRKGNLFLFQT